MEEIISRTTFLREFKILRHCFEDHVFDIYQDKIIHRAKVGDLAGRGNSDGCEMMLFLKRFISQVIAGKDPQVHHLVKKNINNIYFHGVFISPF